MKRKPAPCPLETDEQRALVATLRAYGVGCFSIPNGAIVGGRNRFALIKKLKAEGMLSGAPDLILADRDGKGRPVAVEMKRQRGGVVSDDQREAMDMLSACGWAVVIAKGAGDALAQLKKLGIKRLQRLADGAIRLV